MELKQIKELMSAMRREGIKKLAIKEKTGYELQLEREEERFFQQPYASAAPLVPMKEPEPHGRFPVVSSSAHPPTHAEEKSTHEKKEEKISGSFVTSPMVGTFYASSSPDDPPFVKVGDRVEENTVVCIIEAMKVMNEVKAGISGTIAEVYVENAHPVEFGTKILRIV